jgi:hypothetical protein
LIGALFLDKGFERTRKAVIKLIHQHFDLKEIEKEDRDSKSRLLEWGQKRRKKVEFIITRRAWQGRAARQYVAEVLHRVANRARFRHGASARRRRNRMPPRAPSVPCGAQTEAARGPHASAKSTPQERTPTRSPRRRGTRRPTVREDPNSHANRAGDFAASAPTAVAHLRPFEQRPQAIPLRPVAHPMAKFKLDLEPDPDIRSSASAAM